MYEHRLTLGQDSLLVLTGCAGMEINAARFGPLVVIISLLLLGWVCKQLAVDDKFIQIYEGKIKISSPRLLRRCFDDGS